MVKKYILVVAIGLLCGNSTRSVSPTTTESRNMVVELLTLLNRLDKVPEFHRDILRKARSEALKEQIKLYEQAIIELQNLQQAVKDVQKKINDLKSTNSTVIHNYLNFVQQQREAINEHIRAARQSAQTEEAEEQEAEGKSRGLIARFTYFIKQKIAQWKGVEPSLQELDSASYALISSYMRQLKRWDFVLEALVGNVTSSSDSSSKQSPDALSVAYDDLGDRIIALHVLIQEAERMEAEVQKLKAKPVPALPVIPSRRKITPGVAKARQKPGVYSTQKTARKKLTKIPAQSVHDVWKRIVEISPGYRRVTTARLSPDGTILAILSQDGKCEFYSISTGEFLHTLGREDEIVDALDFIDNNTLVVSERMRLAQRICLFNYQLNKCEKLIINIGVIPRVSQAFYNRHSKKYLMLTYDKEFYSVDVMKVNDQKKLASDIYRMATDCTSGYNVTFSYNTYKIMIWDAQNNLVKEIISDEMITALAINMQINTIAVATAGYSIQLWDIGTGAVYKTLTSEVWQQDDAGTVIKVAEGHSGTIESLDFNNDGTLLLSASHDQTARVWDIKTGTSQVIQESTGPLIRYVQFNCTRDRALIVHLHAVSVWNRELSPEK